MKRLLFQLHQELNIQISPLYFWRTDTAMVIIRLRFIINQDGLWWGNAYWVGISIVTFAVLVWPPRCGHRQWLLSQTLTFFISMMTTAILQDGYVDEASNSYKVQNLSCTILKTLVQHVKDFHKSVRCFQILKWTLMSEKNNQCTENNDMRICSAPLVVRKSGAHL